MIRTHVSVEPTASWSTVVLSAFPVRMVTKATAFVVSESFAASIAPASTVSTVQTTPTDTAAAHARAVTLATEHGSAVDVSTPPALTTRAFLGCGAKTRIAATAADPALQVRLQNIALIKCSIFSFVLKCKTRELHVHQTSVSFFSCFKWQHLFT